MSHSPGIRAGFPGPKFSNELLEEVSSESDFIRYVEDELGYLLWWEDGVELFINFVQETDLLKSSCELLKNHSPSEAQIVGALKHPFVFGRVLTGMSGEDDANVLGIPHAFECYDDLVFSLQLASMTRYKQAQQSLRSALELAVCHAYFSVAGADYDDLPLTPIPPMKDRKRGMLNRLLACRRIEKEVAEGVVSIYGELSLATHSHYKYLNFRFEQIDEAEQFQRFLENLGVVSRLCLAVALSVKSITLYTCTPLR